MGANVIIKEHGMIFSAPMVRALLAGRKTQTRRIQKQPESNAIYAPIQQGDRIWVRETWCPLRASDHSPAPRTEPLPADDSQVVIAFRADHLDPKGDAGPLQWRSPIHLPRRFCRIVLEVTGVRVQQVQEISEADALAEGCIKLPASGRITDCPGGQYAGRTWQSARCWYSDLWEYIHGKGAWHRNDWVWTYTFRRVESPA